MARYKVVPSVHYQRDDGRKASIYGACPWTSDEEKTRWQLVNNGFTVYDAHFNTYGLGRPPFKSISDAESFVAKINAQA